MNINLEAAVKRIFLHGPDRVMVDSEGEALSPSRAKTQYGLTSDVIFIRNDGWSLGAPSRLEREAFRIWAEEWIGFIRRPDTTAKPMAEYLAQ